MDTVRRRRAWLMAIVVGGVIGGLAWRAGVNKVVDMRSTGAEVALVGRSATPDWAQLSDDLMSGTPGVAFDAARQVSAYLEASGEAGHSASHVVVATPDVAYVEESLTSGDESVRAAALATMAWSRPYEAGGALVDILLAGLTDESESVRRAAADVAAAAGQDYHYRKAMTGTISVELSTETHVEAALLTQLIPDADDSVAARATLALFTMHFPASTTVSETLVARYPAATTSELRSLLLDVIGWHAYGGSEVAAVLAAGRTDADAEVRKSAALATGRCLGKAGIPTLEAMRTVEQDEYVLLAIDHSLAQLQ